MAELKTDRQLLREYAEGGSEGAFQELVSRHLDLVFSTALRGLNDNTAAQEITQNVFIRLARKAAWLTAETSLAGWLHKTALFEVRHWWRTELRRRRREQTAVELGTAMSNEDSLLKSLAGELDEGLLSLREGDRQALMLRYFEGRSHREIGALVGAREDAVRMRIEKSLVRLTRFFRRRGYAVPVVATTAAMLSASAKAAPVGLAVLAARSGLAVGTCGTATGLKMVLSRLLGLSKTQTAVLCLALATAPAAWQFNQSRKAQAQAAISRSSLERVEAERDLAVAELDRLSAESARLDASLADAAISRNRQDAARRKLDDLKSRLAELLSDPNNHWPGDLPYVRVRKSVVKSLDLLNHHPTAFGTSGPLTEAALELFAITATEKQPVEAALSNYWRGVEELTAASAYETNLPSTESKRLTKTVIVPPLGEPLKVFAASTGEQIASVLGAEREKLLFDGWDQGGIQLFWPGNLWKISEQPQTFSVWVEPDEDGGEPRWGSSRSSTMGGMSGEKSAGGIPGAVFEKFFEPWLQKLGVTLSSSHE